MNLNQIEDQLIRIDSLRFVAFELKLLASA